MVIMITKQVAAKTQAVSPEFKTAESALAVDADNSIAATVAPKRFKFTIHPICLVFTFYDVQFSS
jgi:hypothetical protein